MSKNPSLQDVLERRAYLKARRARLARFVGTVNDLIVRAGREDRELEQVETVLRRLAGDQLGPKPEPQTSPEVVPGSVGLQRIKESMSGTETVEQLTTRLLSESAPPWWTSSQLQTALSTLKGKQVPMNTLSPTLWKMAKAGVIVRDSLTVALASRIEKAAEPATIKRRF